MKNEKLAEFLHEHKYNCENFNNEGNYDPNPYWLADEIVEFLNLQNVSSSVSKYVIGYVDSNGTTNSTVVLAASTDQALADFTKDFGFEWGSIKRI